ncbi:Uncharacterized protein At1g76660 [Linum perenne]
MRRANSNSNGGRGAVGSGAPAPPLDNSNSALDTINAAANRIASLENRPTQGTDAAPTQKKRWGGCWNIYLCFGYQRRRKQIGHAVVLPEPQPSGTGNGAPAAAENHNQPTTFVFPFNAPPSSPASFLPSEPPSVTQSPAASISLSASMYSPTGPSSIFAIGPYAYETQLVSPPVFSTFTTEPSTAPFTPPPESVHFTNTTPSSPEVPFAQLLDPRFRNGQHDLTFPSPHYEFQYYQFHPGSPAGQLISPCSGISSSGTSSPFRDGQFAAVGFPFMEFHIGEPPNLLSHDKLSPRPRDLGSHQGSGTLTPNSVRSTSNNIVLNRQSSDLGHVGGQNNQFSHQRVSFEWPAGDPLRYEVPNATKPDREADTVAEDRVCEISNFTPEKAPDARKEDEEEEGPAHRRRQRTITLGSAKDFDFVEEDTEGKDTPKPNNWWTNHGSVVGKQGEPLENWSFYPTIQQPGRVN